MSNDTGWTVTIADDTSLVIERCGEEAFKQAPSLDSNIPVEAVLSLLNWERANYTRALKLGEGLCERITLLEDLIDTVSPDGLCGRCAEKTAMVGDWLCKECRGD